MSRDLRLRRTTALRRSRRWTGRRCSFGPRARRRRAPLGCRTSTAQTTIPKRSTWAAGPSACQSCLWCWQLRPPPPPPQRRRQEKKCESCLQRFNHTPDTEPAFGSNTGKRSLVSLLQHMRLPFFVQLKLKQYRLADVLPRRSSRSGSAVAQSNIRTMVPFWLAVASLLPSCASARAASCVSCAATSAVSRYLRLPAHRAHRAQQSAAAD
jgi:hypothetical protein